ncbi:hypothetical protein EMPS_02947 [Entomortierella parvispora]|uniref:Uncharacterized protein n=1 Tax=Entomortierella parvispora TaxID=205924 RepID=A0A9P3LU23_9FUNG|nr:hypothetical protein EMPS_02947 [Entomortierella parvispora]
MSKYVPLFELHQLVQLTHSANGKAIFYSQVHLSKSDSITNEDDEAGGWILSTFTGKTYFEREYRREDLDDLLSLTGDKDWTSFAKRFKKAIIDGYFHIVDTNTRECKVIVDNDIHSNMDNTNQLEMIEIDMYPVSHSNRGEKLGDFMFECAKFIQVHGCSLISKGSASTSNRVSDITPGDPTGKSYNDLKLERDNYKFENMALKQEIEKLRASALNSSSMSHGGINSASGRPKSKTGQMAMMVKEQLLKKRKGVSALNPRMKRVALAKGTEFGSDDDDDEEDA